MVVSTEVTDGRVTDRSITDDGVVKILLLLEIVVLLLLLPEPEVFKAYGLGPNGICFG